MFDEGAGDLSGTAVKNISQDEDIERKIQRPINRLREENKNVRRRALQDILDVVLEECRKHENHGFSISDHFVISLLRVFSDPVEQCRLLAILIVSEVFQSTTMPEMMLAKILPGLVRRLGQQDIIEPSEEIRLQLVKFLQLIVINCGGNIAPYVSDIVMILQRTIIDTYPEVRKCSCDCASEVAKTIPEHFYSNAETLIKPLLLTLTHQHSKVRALVIRTIGTVVQFGNGKLVDDVVSHMAQRLFDPVPSVRLAVIQAVGGWLLDLPDRYSYQPKLIPLLLSGSNDDTKEIQDETDGLWHDIGMKFELENENELKDKIDFAKSIPEHYPKNVRRPNLGCRQMVYNHYSKILPAIINDMADWNEDTRFHAARLLYTMLINEEDNVTQHLDKTLLGLYKACCDDETKVVEYVMKSSELIGYFVDADIWCKMILENIRISQSHGSVLILAHVIKGTRAFQLQPHLHTILHILSDPGICHVAESRIQEALLCCIENIIKVTGDECHSVINQAFLLLLYVLALHRNEDTKLKTLELLDDLRAADKLASMNMLLKKYGKNILNHLKPQSEQWLPGSPQLLVFETLIQLAGGNSLDHCHKDIIEICFANLKTSKSAEVRHTFFALMSHLMISTPSVFRSNKNENLVVQVVRDMILPNCVWMAGRTSEVVRKSAISCLWIILDSQLITKDEFQSLIECNTVNQLRALLDDENKGTRLTTCHVLSKIFSVFGDSMEKDSDLYNLYADLLKRLDDGNDEVRSAASEAFSSYLSCLCPGLSTSLYSAHLEDIFRGLLIHLDDPNHKIQEVVLETLIKNASLSPDLLLKLGSESRLKHRSTEYCDKLIHHIHTTSKPS